MPLTSDILFICNTYMQLITALQIKYTLMKDVNADLMLSDHSLRSEEICKQMEKYHIFHRVKNIQTKKIMYEQGKLADIIDIVALSLGHSGRFKTILLDGAVYKQIFYFNQHDLVPLCVYDESLRHGVHPSCACFEEGIFSYADMPVFWVTGRMGAIRSLRRVLHKDNIFDRTEHFYCFYPEIFPEHQGVCHPIPRLDRKNKTFLQMINTIFGYRPDQDVYPQKYIFFATSSDVDKKFVGETELVKQIADLVGKENLLVKMHPRDSRDVYEKYGISVSRNSAIPWELIQLNHDFSNHVFLTTSSGSVLNASVMLEDHIPTHYLYPLVLGKNKEFDRFCQESIYQTLVVLQKLGAIPEIKITDDLKVILE